MKNHDPSVEMSIHVAPDCARSDSKKASSGTSPTSAQMSDLDAAPSAVSAAPDGEEAAAAADAGPDPAPAQAQRTGTGHEPFRNGRWDRLREVRISNWIIGVMGTILLAMFIAPLTLPEGTVPELSARANTWDYASLEGWGNQNHTEGGGIGHNQSAHGGFWTWTDLPFMHAVAYAFGDFNCHQKHERSWFINDNQMPVCTRDVGVFAGVLVGAVAFRSRGLNRWTMRDTFLSMVPDTWLVSTYRRDRRLLVMWGIIGGLLVPIAMDGGIQALTDYESGHGRRLVTGALAGGALAWYLGAALASRPGLFEGGAAAVQLPAGARLVTPEEQAAFDEQQAAALAEWEAGHAGGTGDGGSDEAE